MLPHQVLGGIGGPIEAIWAWRLVIETPAKSRQHHAF
jgi:hypothetical protein